MNRDASQSLAITGAGCISGLGIGVAAFERALFEGRSAVAPIATFDTSMTRSHVAAQIPDFDPAAFIAPAKLRRIDRVGRLAIAACRLALDDARLLPHTDDVPGDQIGMALGTSTAGLHSLVDYLDRLVAQGAAGASALDFSNTVGNAAASLCAIEFALRGPNVTLSYKEASSLSALAYAAGAVRAGRSRAMVTGGADDFEALFFAVHDEFGVLASDEGDGERSRPFDRRRNGFVMGAGAFVVVMEDPGSAEAREAPALGHVLGVGATASPCALNGWPDEPAGMTRCMRAALEDASVRADEIAVVFASANSTRELDRVEAAALADLFGPNGAPVVSLKGALGESGAVGAASVIAAALSLRTGIMPPTVGFEQPDADCPVDVSATARPLHTGARRAALINSFASGGANFSMVVGA